MKRKRLLLALMVAVLAGTFCIPVSSSSSFNNNSEIVNMGDVLYFENVNVFVIGRCRTIYSDGSWDGGLFIGDQTHSGIETHDSPLERIRIIIYNETILDPWISFSGLSRAIIGMNNASGIFFWGAKGNGIKILPPIIFVCCHASILGLEYRE